MPPSETPREQAPNPYSLKDWDSDWSFLSELARRFPEENNLSDRHIQEMVNYFDRKYRQQADYHRMRLLSAWNFFLTNKEKFDEGSLGVSGKGASQIGKATRWALCHVFGPMADADLETGPNVETVLWLARETEKMINEV